MNSKQIFYIIVALILIVSNSFSQTYDTTFYENGQIKTIKLIKENQILKLKSFKADGKINYEWDINEKIIKSYTNISNDSLINYFKSNSPSYKLYQHYGNGPLFRIENYAANKKHGDFKKFERDGSLMVKGQFKEGEKTGYWTCYYKNERIKAEGTFENSEKIGIWTYYDEKGKADNRISKVKGKYSDKGISITYTIIPVFISILLFLSILLISLRHYEFYKIFYAYSIILIVIFLCLYLIIFFGSDQLMEMVRNQTKKSLIPILTTLVFGKILLSIIALLFQKRTKVRRLNAVLFFITSIGLLFLTILLYIASSITIRII